MSWIKLINNNYINYWTQTRSESGMNPFPPCDNFSRISLFLFVFLWLSLKELSQGEKGFMQDSDLV